MAERIEGNPAAPEEVSHRNDGSTPRRERVRVRRRRSRTRTRTEQWVARPSRRRRLRAIAICAAVLGAMALGLYLGLSGGFATHS